jgi:hypothetical protein
MAENLRDFTELCPGGDRHPDGILEGSYRGLERLDG